MAQIYQQERNQEHYENPVAGDYWHERFCPYFVVLEADNKKREYVVADEKIDVDADNWTFDLSKAKKVGHDYFRRVKYSTNENFVADISNHALIGFVKEWREEVGGKFIDDTASREQVPCKWQAGASSELWGIVKGTVVTSTTLVDLAAVCDWQVIEYEYINKK